MPKRNNVFVVVDIKTNADVFTEQFGLLSSLIIKTIK